MLYCSEVTGVSCNAGLSKWTEVVYLLKLLFDFDTSVNCYVIFCSCGLFGSFLFARHAVSSYDVLAGRTRLNINC